jgi:hypothetical protein
MREQLSGQVNIPATGRLQRRTKHDRRLTAGTLSRNLDRVCVRRLSGDAESEQVTLTPAPAANVDGAVSRNEAFLIAVNVAKLPSVPQQILKDIPRPPNSASWDD